MQSCIVPLHSCPWRTKTADETRSPNTTAPAAQEVVQEYVNGSSDTPTPQH